MNCLDVGSFRRLSMGNVLESDASTDSEIAEIRTDGDGMEMDRGMEMINAPGPVRTGVQGDAVCKGMSIVGDLKGAIGPVTCKNHLQPSVPPVLLNSPKKHLLTSPKELPPMKDLILLKPIRIMEGASSAPIPEPQDITSNVAQNAQSIPSKKQREPKFIPYEPYAGAVRPMGTPSPSPRRESSSSSIALSDDPVSSPAQTQSPKKSLSPRHPSESSNTALLKERLRMSEKDIQDLRIENARLKRLLVDTLSGSPQVQAPQGAGANRMQDSVDSLSNEIQVWRSKFLSSCVLVEYLTKEKEDLLHVTARALELFKEIKATVDLTPELYEGMRTWIVSEEKERTLRKENSFSVQDDDL